MKIKEERNVIQNLSYTVEKKKKEKWRENNPGGAGLNEKGAGP